VTQRPATLQTKSIFLTNKTKEKKKEKRKKKIIKKENLYIKIPKDAANSQILSTSKYS
jgi:hypothetical protein